MDPSGRTPIVLASEPLAERAPEIRLLAVPQGEVRGEFALHLGGHGQSPACPLLRRLQPRPRDLVAALHGCQRAPPHSGLRQPCRRRRLPGGRDGVQRVACVAGRERPVPGAREAVRRRHRPACRRRARYPPTWSLVGNGWWREEGRPELEALAWASRCARGAGARPTRSRPGSKPGTHRITLRAGTEDRTGEESVTVHVAGGSSKDTVGRTDTVDTDDVESVPAQPVTS